LRAPSLAPADAPALRQHGKAIGMPLAWRLCAVLVQANGAVPLC
jgi:hypothetical protein